jgi:type IV fimbrial biogenesis protein FimU
MDHRTKGFTLPELLAAVAVLVILITLAVPGFTRSIQSSKADTEMGDLQRAINYARLEAIDRGVTTRLRPSAGGSVWTGELSVYDSTGTPANVLRVVPAMSSGATLTLPSGVTALDLTIWAVWRRRRRRWSSVTCWERKAGR